MENRLVVARNLGIRKWGGVAIKGNVRDPVLQQLRVLIVSSGYMKLIKLHRTADMCRCVRAHTNESI